MDSASIITIIGGLGGMQGLIELFKWWRGRKIQDRRDIADVKVKENEIYQQQIERYEKRLEGRDTKIDDLYVELRAEQNARLEEIHRRHEVELKLAESENRKCLIRGCKDREPPSDY